MNLLSVFLNYFVFSKKCLSGLLQHALCFLSGFFHLSMLRFIHVVTCINTFLFLSSISLYGCTVVYPFTYWGHLYCFDLLLLLQIKLL